MRLVRYFSVRPECDIPGDSGKVLDAATPVIRNVEFTGAARLYRAAPEWNAELGLVWKKQHIHASLSLATI